MADRALAASAGSGEASGRYRDAERTFMATYGVGSTDRWVDMPGSSGRLRVQDVGSGVPALFVHGTGGSGAYFAPLVAELEGIRALLVDRPGWGLSDPVDFARRPYREIVTDAMRRTLDDLGIERAHVVGASIGNLWALRFAQDVPDRVERLVLLGGGPISPEIAVPPFIKLLRSPVGRVIVALPEKPKMFRKQLEQMGHGATMRASDRLEPFVKWHAALTRETAWARHERDMVRAIAGRDGFVPGLVPSYEEIGEIRAPTLMVVGDADPIGSIDVWRRFVDGFSSGELEVVRSGGHVLWLDDPATVGGWVSRFLTSSA